MLLAGCSAILESPPEPTPLDFPGIAGQLESRGVLVDSYASGDAGCDDPTLTPTAIGFDASGLSVTDPLRLRVYIFRNAEAYDRRRADVDACVAAWVTDPATFELIDARPFVLAGQGPWPDEFEGRRPRGADGRRRERRLRPWGGPALGPSRAERLRRSRRPRILRAMTSRWIWLVPSPISVSFASRR